MTGIGHLRVPAALLLAVALAGPAAPAAAAYAGVPGVSAAGSSAASTDCVGVVVDFTRLGGSVQTGCAEGDPDTGLAALTGAGFAFTPRPRDYLICQINGQPDCEDTTSDNYWSYWHRAPGSSAWTYSSVGPASHDPQPGSTEGWVWQEGGKAPPPGTAQDEICPVAEPEPTPSKTKEPTKAPPPKPTPTATSASGSGAGEPAEPGRRPGTGKPGKPGAGKRGDTAKRRATPPSVATKSPLSASPAAEPQATDAPPAAERGAPLGLLVGGGLVAGLAAAAVARARRARPGP